MMILKLYLFQYVQDDVYHFGQFGTRRFLPYVKDRILENL